MLTPLGSEQTTSLLVVLICLQPTMGGFIKFGPKNKRTHATIGPCTFSAGVIDKIMWTTYYNCYNRAKYKQFLTGVQKMPEALGKNMDRY